MICNYVMIGFISRGIVDGCCQGQRSGSVKTADEGRLMETACEEMQIQGRAGVKNGHAGPQAFAMGRRSGNGFSNGKRHRIGRLASRVQSGAASLPAERVLIGDPARIRFRFSINNEVDADALSIFASLMSLYHVNNIHEMLICDQHVIYGPYCS